MILETYSYNNPIFSVYENIEFNTIGNLVVVPSVGLCVKGRLLISYGNGGYAELKDISLTPAEGQEYAKIIMKSMSCAFDFRNICMINSFVFFHINEIAIDRYATAEYQHAVIIRACKIFSLPS